MFIRIQKHIASLGICSRRKAEELIAEGKVSVNGTLVTEQGIQIDPTVDTIEIEGYQTAGKHTPEKFFYVAVNKPVDYICSSDNSQGETVLDLIHPDNYMGKNKQDIQELLKARLYPVGRLDKDSEGLVLLTNDGDLTNQLTHPRYYHEKEYEIIIDRSIDHESRKILEKGMNLDEGEYVQGIQIGRMMNKGKRILTTVILTEGKNRQIRRMFGQLGYRISSLKRTRVGKLKLNVLPMGRWREVQKSDIV